MKSIFYKIIAIIALLCIVVFFICTFFLKGAIKNKYSRDETIEKLNDAQIIQIRQKFSIGKYYEILVDDEIVATVQGKPFHLLGDTFSMYSSDGSLIATETEEVLHLNHQAVFRDYNGKEVFHMSDKIFSIGHKLNLYDTNDNLIGKSEQKVLHLLRKDNYFNSNDELIWKSNKNFSIIGSYDIKKVSENEDTLGAVNVVFLNCIEDAIDKPTHNNNSKNSNSNSNNNSNSK